MTKNGLETQNNQKGHTLSTQKSVQFGGISVYSCIQKKCKIQKYV